MRTYGSRLGQWLYVVSGPHSAGCPCFPPEFRNRWGKISNLKHVEMRDVLGQRFNELEDIRISTHRLKLILGNFLCWFDGSEKNIEFDSSSIKGLSLVKQVKNYGNTAHSLALVEQVQYAFGIQPRETHRRVDRQSAAPSVSGRVISKVTHKNTA